MCESCCLCFYINKKTYRQPSNSRCHHSGRPHWKPLNSVLCRPRSLYFSLTDMRSQQADGRRKKGLSISAGAYGCFWLSKQKNTDSTLMLKIPEAQRWFLLITNICSILLNRSFWMRFSVWSVCYPENKEPFFVFVFLNATNQQPSRKMIKACWCDATGKEN